MPPNTNKPRAIVLEWSYFCFQAFPYFNVRLDSRSVRLEGLKSDLRAIIGTFKRYKQ